MSAPAFSLSVRNRLLSLIYSDHLPLLQGWLLSQDAFVGRALGHAAMSTRRGSWWRMAVQVLRLG